MEKLNLYSNLGLACGRVHARAAHWPGHKNTNKMKENINIKGLQLNDEAIDVLKELQVQGNGPAAMYMRVIDEVVDRLLLDEDGDPLQNLEQARALKLLKLDIQTINSLEDNEDIM